jgi:hypothetical protein
MNVYWFGRTRNNNLSEISLELEESGFNGILLPYGADVGDYFVQIARSLKKDQKVTYIVAVRPYTISPQNLAMIIKSLNSIDTGRVWINFVSGQILDEEKSMGGIIGEINDTSSLYERREYLKNYIPIFFDFCKKFNIDTKICISGKGDDMNTLVENYGDYSFAAYQSHIEVAKYKKISKPRVLSIFPLIEDDEEKFNKLKHSKELGSDIRLTTTLELKEIINELKLDGIEGIMFYCYWPEEYRIKIVNFVKDNKNLFI